MGVRVVNNFEKIHSEQIISLSVSADVIILANYPIMKKIKSIQAIANEDKANFDSTLVRYPKEIEYFNRLSSLYQTLSRSFKKVYPREQVAVLQMFWVCFRGLLLSSRLMMEAHIPESFAIVSRSAESVASARKMSLHPEKILEWIKKEKETSQPFRRVLGKLFPPKDKILSPEVFQIYETTTEHGRHPNFASTIFFSGFGKLNTENKVEFAYCDIGDELNLRRSINYLIYSYIKFLDVFQEIFKKYLKTEWIKEFNEFKQNYNEYKQTLRKVFEEEK